MKERFQMKSWAGPLTIGSFLVVAVTGVLMLCHATTSSIKHMHEVISLVFLVGAVAHIAVNWKTFLAYFRKPGSVAVIAIFLILGAVSLFPHGSQSGRDPRRGMLSALEQSSLNLIAQVVKSDLQSVKTALEANGIPIRDGEQTLLEIASESKKSSMEIMAIVVNQSQPSPNAP
jgi:hypothetical protein